VAAGETFRVVEVDAASTHELRRRVLRVGMDNDDVDFPTDHHPDALHLAVVTDDHELVGIASFSPEATPYRPEARAVRLRGMAVEPSRQGRGIGRLLMGAACEHLRARDVEVLWANARDSALGFYEGLGMEVVGDGFLAVGLPHHVVACNLSDLGKGLQSGRVATNEEGRQT
jgi:GNAT superfamily N-acetyltransferase